jgi:predicted Zn-dependent protease
MTNQRKIERVFEAMNQAVERWQDTGDKRVIVSEQITFLPRRITGIVKEWDTIEVEAQQGAIVTDIDSQPTKISGCNVMVNVGDLEDGGGLGFGGTSDHLSLVDLRNLIATVDRCLDESYKKAQNEYFAFHSQTSTESDPTLFKKLSFQEPVTLTEEEQPFGFSISEVVELVKKAAKELHSWPEIEESNVDLILQRENRWIVAFERDSRGKHLTRVFTSSVRGHIKFKVTVRDKEDRPLNYVEKVVSRDLSEVLNEANIEEALRRLREVVEGVFQAEVQTSGLFKAVFDGDALDVLIHEGLVAHLLSGRMIDEEKATTYRDMLGQLILPPFVNIIDDPTIPNGFGSYVVDEEGVIPQRLKLVEDGRLTNFLLDRVSGGRRNVPSNGRSRAEGFQDPEPRTTNLLIFGSGECYSEKELIAMMIEDCKRDGDEYGLLIRGSSGQVDPESGDFQLFPYSVAQVYPDGTVIPVTSTFITCIPLQVLQNIKALGNELKIERSHCFSESGMVPVESQSVPCYLEAVEIHTSTEVGKRRPILRRLMDDDIKGFGDEDEED